MLGYKTIEEFTLEECETFLGRTDISEENRQCAQKRKEYLMHMPPPPPPPPEKTIIERFPEFDFSPTERESVGKWFYFAEMVVGLILSCFGIVYFVSSDFSGIMIILGGPLLIGGFLNFIKHKPIASVADYVPKNRKIGIRRKHMIIVKDKKFGVIEKDYNSVEVPAQYDKLSWKSKRESDILIAEKDGHSFLIDIHGNELN